MQPPIPYRFRNIPAARAGRRQRRAAHLRDVGAFRRKWNHPRERIRIARRVEERLPLRRHLHKNLFRTRVGPPPPHEQLICFAKLSFAIRLNKSTHGLGFGAS